MPDAFRCSDAARERADPLLGTAPPQRRLLLVEQDSGWGPDALASLAVPDDIREQVRSRTSAVGTRVMLIRRPGRQRSSVCLVRAWCVVDPFAPQGHRVTWGTWSYPTDLVSALERVEELDGWAQGAGHASLPAPSGEDDPVLLVCTNGRKDQCCALRGRPVASALARRWPEQTWECTHTGGDRFAANLVVLPEGAAYGGLDPDCATDVVQAHREGRPGSVQEHLRGLIGYPRPLQAALVGAMAQLGLPWGHVRPGARVVRSSHLSEEQVRAGADQLAAQGSVVARWFIDIDIDIDGRPAPGWRAEVTEHLRPAAPLTCKALGEPAHSRVPVLASLTPRS